jgi:hypothetical protein
MRRFPYQNEGKPLYTKWDDLTGYMDFIPYAYDADLDGMSVHVIMSGLKIPVPSAIFLLGSGLIGLVGFRRKFGK